MAALATQPELEALLGRTVDAGQAQLLLDVASGQIRDHVGWTITAETAAVATLNGDGTRYLWLPTKYLTTVTSVVEDSVTLTAATEYEWQASGLLIRKYRGWACGSRNIVVTFNHGYSTVPASVKGACLSLASRVTDNPTGVRQQSIDDFNQTFAGTAASIGPSLNDTERAALFKYVRVGA